MTSLDRMMAAIYGSCQHPPVVIPYMQYYWPEVVERLTPFTRSDLLEGAVADKIEAIAQVHEYFDYDWVRVTTDPPWGTAERSARLAKPGEPPVPAERLLDEGFYGVAIGLTRRFKDEKFVYGRVYLPYGAIFRDFSDIAGAMIALKRQPDRCQEIIEGAIPQLLEEVRAWAEVGVHALWLGEWLSSADVISERDYLRFVYPYDKVIVDAVRAAGMIPIHHFTGDAIPRMAYLQSMNPPIIGVEESRKTFDVDIGKVRAAVGPEQCLLGNVDVYDVVERGTPDDWAREVERQIRAAGPQRFIVSCGSPITHDTPPERVRDFIQTAKAVRDQ
ncbi:MAG: hypothetical protein JXD18_15585 [Anaerolineae bacterium]|nr:hypothetical protein [Anaerolineae bacterium]